MRPKVRLGATLLVTALVLAACASTTTVGPGRTLKLTLTEYRLAPAQVHARAGALAIRARNVGRLTHNIVVLSGGQPVATSMPIPPGSSAWVRVDLPPGSYTLASNLLSDQDLGLYGTLTVTR